MLRNVKVFEEAFRTPTLQWDGAKNRGLSVVNKGEAFFWC